MVSRINRLRSFVAALALSIVSFSTAATEIDNVVFFGDSLSDTGNIWFATAGFPPPPPTFKAAPEGHPNLLVASGPVPRVHLGQPSSRRSLA